METFLFQTNQAAEGFRDIWHNDKTDLWKVILETETKFMLMMNVVLVTVIFLLSSTCYCRVEEDDRRYQNSLESLLTPTLCQLKLICAISQSKDNVLKSSDFMRGISVLAGYKGNITVPLMLERAIKTGENNPVKEPPR